MRVREHKQVLGYLKYNIANAILSIILFFPEFTLLILWSCFYNNISLVIPLLVISIKVILLLTERIMTTRINDYFIAYEIKLFNIFIIYQQIDKKKINSKDCKTKYYELRNMANNFDMKLLKANKTYLTITHDTIINGLMRIEGIYIKNKIYLLTKNLDKLQYQIFLCKNTKNKCVIRRTGKMKRKFYFVKFKYEGME